MVKIFGKRELKEGENYNINKDFDFLLRI